jgi:hypothetical protein
MQIDVGFGDIVTPVAATREDHAHVLVWLRVGRVKPRTRQS